MYLLKFMMIFSCILGSFFISLPIVMLMLEFGSSEIRESTLILMVLFVMWGLSFNALAWYIHKGLKEVEKWVQKF